MKTLIWFCFFFSVKIIHSAENVPVLPVLSEKVNDVQRRSIHQSHCQVKSRLPLFLK